VRHKFIFIVNKGSSLGGFLPRQAFIKNNTTQKHKSIVLLRLNLISSLSSETASLSGLGIEYAKYIKCSHRYFV
jgi:hypothetical protein